MMRNVVAIVGWKRTLFYTLRLDEIRDWFLRIWFCHHNARVIADFEHRMACVLTTCTSGMSKPYYTFEAMRCEIEQYLQDRYDEGYEDGQQDLRAELEGNQ
jgi:hypothetical protein